MPNRNTPAVCAAVTTIPSNTACLAVPREPTRYAATTVLPCPGSRACSAPSSAAIRAEENNSQRLKLLWVEMSSVKRLRGVFRAGAATDCAAVWGADGAFIIDRIGAAEGPP